MVTKARPGRHFTVPDISRRLDSTCRLSQQGNCVQEVITDQQEKEGKLQEKITSPHVKLTTPTRMISNF
jgi:hypothetical protein